MAKYNSFEEFQEEVKSLPDAGIDGDKVITKNGKIKSRASLANLKVLTADFAKENSVKAAEASRLKAAQRVAFVESSKMFTKMMSDLPALAGIDVLKFALHKALLDDDMEAMIRIGQVLAEYEQPKLARVETKDTTGVTELSDDDLKKIVQEEGLDIKLD